MTTFTKILIAGALLLPASALAAAAGASASICTQNYDPVCGSHQVECIRAPCYPVYQTYGNSCEMDNAGATLIHKGECTASETGMIKPATEPTTPPVVTPPTYPPLASPGFFARFWHWILNLF